MRWEAMLLDVVRANWLAWSLQILIVSAMGYLAPRLLRITDPKSRLLGAQFTLVVCLIIPVSAPRVHAKGEVSIVTQESLKGTLPGRRIPAKPVSAWSLAIPGLMAAGLLVRLAGLSAGLWKLGRYRRSSRLLDTLPEAVNAAMALTDVWCPVAMSPEAHSPATFGLLRPIVLLPERFLTLSREAQLAIACHELLHVRRHDWLAALLEEIVGSVLWFQPAVYLVIADIRLAREQVVDRSVVQLTRARTPYVEALLAVAGEPFGAAISMAPMFLHRRNLKSRITFLLEELYMSKTKMVFANVSLAALLCGAGWVSSVTFPLVAVAQEKAAPKKDSAAPAENLDYAKAFPPATGMRIRLGGNVLNANLLSKVTPAYPAEAKAARIQGKVKFGVLVGTDGHVSDLVLISGDPALVQNSVDAVHQWVYRPTLLNGEPVEVTSTIDVNYTLQP
jgi:TonB family protein